MCLSALWKGSATTNATELAARIWNIERGSFSAACVFVVVMAGVSINYCSNYTDVTRNQKVFRREGERGREGARGRERESCPLNSQVLSLWAEFVSGATGQKRDLTTDRLHHSPQRCINVPPADVSRPRRVTVRVVFACRQSRHVDQRLKLRAPTSSLHGLIWSQHLLKR